MQVYELAYGPVRIGLKTNKALLDRLHNELSPFFELATSVALQDICLRVYDQSPPSEIVDLQSTPATSIDVDTSLYQHLCSSGKHWNYSAGHVVHIDKTGSTFVVDLESGFIDCYQSNSESQFIDVVRAIKGLTTVLLEEMGAVQLHASAVTINDQPNFPVVLLVGDMWKGKTTVLLELLDSFEVSQLSCDTTVVIPEKDGFYVRGWPSPFSVSQGTMCDYQQLAEKIDIGRRDCSYETLWVEAKKQVFESSEIVKLFGTKLQASSRELAGVVHLDFAPEKPSGIKELDEPSIREVLEMAYLGSRDPIYHNWLKYRVTDEKDIVRNIESISRQIATQSKAHQVTWAPSISSLLKRIAPLGKADKVLGSILSQPHTY